MFSGVAIAQKATTPSPKSGNNDVNVRIIERNGNEVREIERTYRIDGMTDPQRDKMVMKLVDSLKATRKDGAKRQMTIIVEDGDGDRIVTRERLSPGKRRRPAMRMCSAAEFKKPILTSGTTNPGAMSFVGEPIHWPISLIGSSFRCPKISTVR